jgi:hypothetical protein
MLMVLQIPQQVGAGGCVYNVSNNKIQVGSNIDVSHFPGSISNLQFYNRTLSATEVVQNYNAYRNEFISTNVSAIGGTITFNTINGLRYKVHTFTSSGNFTVYTGGEIELYVLLAVVVEDEEEVVEAVPED